MRKFLLPLVVFLFCAGNFASANAQVTRLQAREAEWKNYALPPTNFTRQINPDKNFIFRVPADWQQEGSQFKFKGPYAATLEIGIQKIPDGYPFEDYFASVLQGVRDIPGATESLVTRKTQLQDLDAREIFLEMTDAEGQLIRSTSWLAVQGPQALIFNLKVAAAHAAEVEPYFKAVVQSVIFVPFDYGKFETARNATIKNTASHPINEVDGIVASLIDTTPEREAAVTRLAALFSTTPEVAFDLLLDRRPLVRVAAVQALGRSNNSSLTPLLWELLNDREPLVTEAAARRLGNSPDVVAKLLQHSMSGFHTQKIAHVWPFMPKEKRKELLQAIFKETAVGRPAPPPRVKAPPKPGVTVRVTDMTAVQPGKPPPPIGILAVASQDPNVQIGALALLMSVPVDEFKLPLERIMAAHYDPLIAVGLQVAIARGESLPVAPLLKLLLSSDKQVSTLAAQNLAFSASMSDISLIEALISKDGARKALDNELKNTIKKINFRHQLSSAKTEDERRELIGKSLSDSSLTDFAWRYHCEATVNGCTSALPKLDFTTKPFAENLFPQKVSHYTAIPNPRETVQKFYGTLSGLQMDSPRAQSDFVLLLTSLRQLLGSILSAPHDAEALIDFTGINPDSPIALGSWTAPNAHDSSTLAQRNAIVLRVKDRVRFERLVEKLQAITGGLAKLTGGIAVGTRAIAVLPATLPFTAQAALSSDAFTPEGGPLLRYSLLADKEWNGLRIRIIEHVWINRDWTVQSDPTYLAYLGDTAILARDLATIRELLANATSDRPSLVGNSAFREAIDSSGDVVYFSDLKAIFGDFSEPNKNSSSNINERGALKFSGSSWENSHQLNFDESEWSKPLLPFHPKDLTAPRELLPSSTIAYFLTKVDLPLLWTASAKDLFSKTELEAFPALWLLDFKQDVLPELGPECGAVMLESPKLPDFNGGAWAAFCKLKSNKLSEALKAGKLLLGVGPTTGVAELKAGADSYFIATRNGFLVVSNSAKGIAALDGKTNLAATRDYSRSVEKVPSEVVAFGGYNLEAAVAAVTGTKLDEPRAYIADRLSSVASAFHSQNFYATAGAATVSAHSSVSMDREGRYPIGDFSNLPRNTNLTHASLEPTGVPITDRNRLSAVVLKVRAKAPGPIDNIKDEIKSADQFVEQKSPTELLLTVSARRAGAENSIQLPVKDPALAPYLEATNEFAAGQKEVIDQARAIAGKDRDAWSVALKLADWTHKNLEWKHVLRADPVLTLATREADCTEFSALFVGMARSLGLPARMVTGLAYSGSSFGGHAWVEVWIGKWIELDPTWGTSFVDATHIRASERLLTAAALNLLELEVVETRRTVPEFQKTSRALAEHLAKAIPASDRDEIEAALDIAILTDEHMGTGAWAKLNDAEREQMWSGYRRVVGEIILGYQKDDFGEQRIRVLHVDEKGDTAEAIGLVKPMDTLLKFRFVRRDNVWHLVELVQSDTGLRIAAEILQPAILAIEKIRAGEKPPTVAMSDFVRVLLLLDENSTKAASFVDQFLTSKPKDHGLRYLKALALLRNEKADEGQKLLAELADEGHAPATYRLADSLSSNEDEKDAQKSLELYERYTKLEPRDPRGFRDLAYAYDDLDRHTEAEAAYRKAVELDPADIDNYQNLIEFLLVHDRISEVSPWLVAGERYQAADEDLFDLVIQRLALSDEIGAARNFAASEPSRMKTSATANLWLGRALSNNEHYLEAERLLNTAAQLDKKSTAAHIALAVLYRKQSRWLAALNAANKAVSLDAEDSEAYYQKACALARLGRIKEAMAALTKSVELDEDQTMFIAEEEDLKPLASLPAFKKLLPAPEKQQP